MKMRFVILSLVIFVCGCVAFDATAAEREELWPPIEPYQTGYLRVSDIHEIYYELCGNSKGKPVFVLHGGPGGSCSPYMRRFFNPKKFLIVLFDQRGCGKSRPFADIRENTTQDLVQDIERLRKELKLDKILLFGGSWGSTLGLAYAETYPSNVSGMVLRGIFTATSAEIDYFYNGGVRNFFPNVYDTFRSALPDSNGKPVPQLLLELISTGSEAQKMKYSRVWARYELKVSGLYYSDKWVEGILDKFNPLAFGLLENYYMANRCFLEEGQLLRDAGKIQDIPLVMVNGRYDMICRPITAYRLHQELPNSKLIITEEAGHWMGEEPNEKALLKAMQGFE
jgi:proline iminopeptidase